MARDIGELVVIGQAFVDVALSESEEFFGQCGVGAFEEVETSFLHGEFFEFGFRGLGIEFERIGVLVGRRAVAIEWPVTAVDGVFDAILGLAHVDAVCDAGAVGDDERRAFVFFGFLEGLEGLVAVGAEGDGGDVNITVSHGELAEVFLAARFAAGCEFGDGAARGRLGGLTAGVRVNLGVEDEDVDVATQREDVIESAVTDVISPAVAAHDPERTFEEGVGDVEEALAVFAVTAGEFGLEGRDVGADAVEVGIRLLFAVHEAIDEVFTEFVGVFLQEGFGEVHLLVEGEAHTETEFGVVFEEAVGPGRTVAVFVGCPRRGGQVAAVNRGAARRVGDDHAITEELADELNIRRFVAACARTGELEQRLNKLRALDRGLVDFGTFLIRKRVEEFEVGTFFVEVIEAILHAEGTLGCCRTLAYANAATGAVIGINLDAHLGAGFDFLAFPVAGREARGRTGEFVGREGLDADGGVRAADGAECAADAGFGVPNGDVTRNTAFFPARRGRREVAVRIENARRQVFAFVLDEFAHDLLDVFGSARVVHRDAFEIANRAGDLDFVQVLDRGVDGGIVLLNDGFAFLAVGFI